MRKSASPHPPFPDRSLQLRQDRTPDLLPPVSPSLPQSHTTNRDRHYFRWQTTETFLLFPRCFPSLDRSSSWLFDGPTPDPWGVVCVFLRRPAYSFRGTCLTFHRKLQKYFVLLIKDKYAVVTGVSYKVSVDNNSSLFRIEYVYITYLLLTLQIS